MSGIRIRIVLVAAVLALAGAVGFTQSSEGMFRVIDPPPRAPIVVSVEPSGDGYRMLFVAGQLFSLNCNRSDDALYTCAGEADLTVEGEPDSDRIVLTEEQYGDAYTLHRVASGNDGEVFLHRGESEYGEFVEAAFAPTGDGYRLRFFGGEIVVDAELSQETPGELRGSVDGEPVSLVVEGDKATLDMAALGLPQMTLARVLYGVDGEPARTAAVGPRFGDFALDGPVSSAFEAWYAQPLPPSHGVGAAALELTDRLNLEPESGFYSHLSPDGERFLAHEPGARTISVHDSATGARGPTVSLPHPFDAPYSVAWSPDGQAFAFGRDTGLLTGDHDDRLFVMVADLANDRVRTLTDAATSDGSGPDGELVHRAPVWVGRQELVFERRRGSDYTLAHVDLASGAISDAFPIPVAFAPYPPVFRFVPTSGELLTIYSAGTFDENGLRVAEPGARAFEIDLPFDFAERLALGDVSFDGRYAIILPEDMGRGVPGTDAMLYDRRLGTSTPVAPGGADTPLLGAVFSPDGSKLLYLYQDPEAERVVLAVRDAEGGDERVLVAEMPGYPSGVVGLLGDTGLRWGANDRIMVPYGNGAGAIFATLSPARR